MISLLQQSAAAVGDTAVVTVEGAADGSVEGVAVVVETVADPAAAAATQAAAAAGGHATGMPQLDATTFANQAFWLVVCMVAIWWVLTRIALPRIAALLADRQNAISSDLEAAEALRAKARESEAAYDAALAEARAEAHAIAAEQKAAMQAGLDAAIARADAEIAERSAQSEARIGEIRASAVTDAEKVAREATGELLRAFGGSVDDEAIAAAVARHVQTRAQGEAQ